MKKKLLLLLSTVALLSLVACGNKDAGDPTLMEQVQNGTYDGSIENKENYVNENGWHIEIAALEEADESIVDLTKEAKDLDCSTYLGYKVEEDQITYVFSGVKSDGYTKGIAYITQTTDYKISVEYGDYSELEDIILLDSLIDKSSVSDNSN